MNYVYIIRSIDYPEQVYVGYTKDLKKRLYNHNSGTTHHTEKYKPWKIVMYVAFECEKKARAFEKYLKSHSGRSFAQKRFL